MIGLINSSVESISSSLPSPSFEVGRCVQLFIENCFRFPSASVSLKEIADRFKCQKEFYDFCATNHINTNNYRDQFGFSRRLNPDDICPEGTVLLSHPEHCCLPSHKEGASPELLENLQFAESLVQYVQEKVPHALNYLSKTFTKDDPGHLEVFRERFKNPSWPVAPDALKQAKSALDRIKEKKMGVCQELALVGMMRAWKKHPDRNVEMAFIWNGRHVFLIINRKEGSDPSNHRTWGEDCVVCDPWAGKVYPLTKLEGELFDFLGELRDDYEGSEMSYPYVRPFDSQTQKVAIYFKPLSPEDKKSILFGNGGSVPVEFADPSLFA